MTICSDVLNPQPLDIINLQAGRNGDFQNVFVRDVRDGRVYYQKNYAREIVDMDLGTWRKKAAHWIVY